MVYTIYILPTYSLDSKCTEWWMLDAIINNVVFILFFSCKNYKEYLKTFIWPYLSIGNLI